MYIKRAEGEWCMVEEVLMKDEYYCVQTELSTPKCAYSTGIKEHDMCEYEKFEENNHYSYLFEKTAIVFHNSNEIWQNRQSYDTAKNGIELKAYTEKFEIKQDIFDFFIAPKQIRAIFNTWFDLSPSYLSQLIIDIQQESATAFYIAIISICITVIHWVKRIIVWLVNWCCHNLLDALGFREYEPARQEDIELQE